MYIYKKYNIAKASTLNIFRGQNVHGCMAVAKTSVAKTSYNQINQTKLEHIFITWTNTDWPIIKHNRIHVGQSQMLNRITKWLIHLISYFTKCYGCKMFSSTGDKVITVLEQIAMSRFIWSELIMWQSNSCTWSSWRWHTNKVKDNWKEQNKF